MDLAIYILDHGNMKLQYSGAFNPLILIRDGEVEKIKARTKASLINRMNSNMGLAMQLTGYQSDWGDWREMFKSLDKINAVTAEDIQRVAQKYLTKQNRTVAKLNTSGS